MRQAAINRIRIITAGVLLISLVLIGRLYYLQVIDHATYVARAEAQYVDTVQDLYSRGSIYFTTKEGDTVSAATIRSGYLLAVNPSRLENREAVFEALSQLLPLDKDSFFANTGNPDRVYYEVWRRVDKDTAELLSELDLKGVELYRNQWRYYPGYDLSARTVGFVGFTSQSDDRLVGIYGLERYYEDTLNRQSNRLSVNFFAELFGNLGDRGEGNDRNKSGDIVTSIEPTVARYLDHKLNEVQEERESKLTGGIIMNPQTGAIYAMNTVPTFDLNDRAGIGIEQFRNPLVEDVYEMGSIIKALTMASGLDSGAITPQSTYYDSGSVELDTFIIRNFDGVGRGTVDMQAVLSQSLNTGVAHIARKMGKDTFRQYFTDLRLGQETGIDLPNESYGLVANLESPREVEYATASFGQGIALTPIATVRALSALGNGGRLVTPHLATAVHYQDGSVKEVSYPPGEQVFSAETSEEISRMLVQVVDEALRGGDVKLDGYSVGAKTGTAQIAHPQGGYYSDRYLHSFFGYFPAYDPQFLVFLYTVEPRHVTYASETLTDPFIDITKFLINYYDIPPDR